MHEAAPTDLQNSSYAFVYSPTVAGLYSIEIRVTATPADFLGGEVVQVAGAASLVGGRLHPSVVLPAPLDVPSCTVSGPGTVAATAGHAAPLIIQGRDQWSNMRTQDDGPFSYALHATRLSQSAASLSEVDVSGDAVYDDELGAGLIDMRECVRREGGECDGAREQRRRGERCREHTAAPLEGWRGGLTVPENRCWTCLTPSEKWC